MTQRLTRKISKGLEGANASAVDYKEKTRTWRDGGLAARAFFFGLITSLAAALPAGAQDTSSNDDFRGNPSSLSAASKTEDGSAGVDGTSGAATVRIPMGEGMESLNVAAAAAVVLFEAVRQRLDSKKK